MRRCGQCGAEVGSQLKACPNCSALLSKKSFFASSLSRWIVALVVVVVLFTAATAVQLWFIHIAWDEPPIPCEWGGCEKPAWYELEYLDDSGQWHTIWVCKKHARVLKREAVQWRPAQHGVPDRQDKQPEEPSPGGAKSEDGSGSGLADTK